MEPDGPRLPAGKGFMSLLSICGIIIAAYAAAGRTGAITACLLLGIRPWQTLVVAVVLDFVQIPVCGLLLEASQRRMTRPGRFYDWVRRKSEKLHKRILSSSFWKWLVRFRSLSVVTVSMLPIRGCGIFSACALAFMFGWSRLQSTCLIMFGSLAGACITLILFYFPARWLHAL